MLNVKFFQNRPISGGGDGYWLPIDRISDGECIFILAYPAMLTANKIYQNKTGQFSSKTH